MSIMLTSREFNQNTSAVKRAAKEGPVFITNRGRTEFVVLSAEQYESLKPRKTLLEVVAQDTDDDFEFQPEKLNLVLKPVDFG